MMGESGLNDLVCSLVSAGGDTKKKLSVGQQIIDYLGAGDNQVSGSDDVGTLVDTLVPWLNSSNFKVRQPSKNLLNLQYFCSIFGCFVSSGFLYPNR